MGRACSTTTILLLALSGCEEAAPPAPAAVDAGSATMTVKTPQRPAWQVLRETAGARWDVAARAHAIDEGAAVLGRHQCTRCHEIDGLASAGRPYDCVKCHVFLKGLVPGERAYEDIAAHAGKGILERYQRNLVHLRRVPDLSGVARRVRPEWIERFLPAPFDVRPVLEESMIRNRLTPGEIRAVIRYFAAIADAPDPAAAGYQPDPPRPPPSPARLAAGQQRFVELGCPSCHVLGNVDFGAQVNAGFLETMRDRTLLAPNLRFARDRLRPSSLADWIRDPQSLLPGTVMPQLEGSRADAELLADYVLAAPAPPLPPPATEAVTLRLPPPASHPVAWEEVKERVLGKVCVHCHMNDHEKDTGPGNRGGFGYPGRGLSFRTYERAVFGAASTDDPKGARHSVFEVLPGEKLPRVVEVLMLRRVENRRDKLAAFEDRERPDFAPRKDGLLGMPLGLPAMTDEEIGIMRRWISDGCPGPRATSGKAGITDGFLVPDGPIGKNRGCEVRRPATPPPAWASAPGWAPR